MAALQTGLDATNAMLEQLRAHVESIMPKFAVFDATQVENTQWKANVESMLLKQKKNKKT